MVTSKTIANGILRAITVIVFSALLLYFLYQIQSVLVYLTVALILTLIGNPILDFFRKRLKFNHVFATIGTLFIFMVIIAGFIMMFIPLILSQGQNLSLLNTGAIEQQTIQLVSQISIFLENHHIDLSKALNASEISSKINFNIIPNFLNAILTTISSFGMGLASVLFITFFFLKERKSFITGIKRLIPDSHEDQFLNSLEKTNSLLSR